MRQSSAADSTARQKLSSPAK
jgi:hypothetical protein